MESPFKKINYMLFGIGLLSIVIGYLIIWNNTVDSNLSTRVGPMILFLVTVLLYLLLSFISQKNNLGW